MPNQIIKQLSKDMNKPFIGIRNSKVLKRIEIDSIYTVVGDSYSSMFVLAEKEEFYCNKTIGDIEKLLPNPPLFFRINRSTIININKIIELDYHKRVVLLSDHNKYRISVRKIKELTNILESVIRK